MFLRYRERTKDVTIEKMILKRSVWEYRRSEDQFIMGADLQHVIAGSVT